MKEKRDQHPKSKTDKCRSHKEDSPRHGYAEKKKFCFNGGGILQNDNDTKESQYGDGDHLKSFHDKFSQCLRLLSKNLRIILQSFGAYQVW